jgi:hypothetical protein
MSEKLYKNRTPCEHGRLFGRARLEARIYEAQGLKGYSQIQAKGELPGIQEKIDKKIKSNREHLENMKIDCDCMWCELVKSGSVHMLNERYRKEALSKCENKEAQIELEFL